MVISEVFSKIGGMLGSRLEAEILLSFVTGRSRERIFAHPGAKITPAHARRLKFLREKRENGVPLAYLTHHKEFFGLDFYVDERVLIPRPETELLVEEALRCVIPASLLCHPRESGDLFRTSDYADKNEDPSFANRSRIKCGMTTVCDVGTGSGCIAISLAKNLPEARFFAVDISGDALAVARKNAKTHGVQKRIEFKKSDLLENVLGKPITGIVANLPYIANGDKLVDKEVRKYEPEIALFSGDTGLELFDRLFGQVVTLMLRQAQHDTKSDNLQWLICEVGAGQKSSINTLIKKHFGNVPVMWKNDLAGIPRVFTINYVR